VRNLGALNLRKNPSPALFTPPPAVLLPCRPTLPPPPPSPLPFFPKDYRDELTPRAPHPSFFKPVSSYFLQALCSGNDLKGSHNLPPPPFRSPRAKSSDPISLNFHCPLNTPRQLRAFLGCLQYCTTARPFRILPALVSVLNNFFQRHLLSAPSLAFYTFFP